MQLRDVPLAQLKPAPYNPRRPLKKGSPAWSALAASMDTFGTVQPLVWNERTGFVVGGHQRLAILKARGVRAVPCVVVDLDPERERALNLALNKTGELAGWDQAALSDVLANMNDDMLPLTGFDAAEIDALLGKAKDAMEDAAAAAGRAGGDDEPGDGQAEDEGERPESTDKADRPLAAKPVPTVQPGEVWQLGDHWLLCGDSLSPDDMARLMAAAGQQTVAMVLCDPPYAIFGSSTGVASDIADDKMVRPLFAAIAQQAMTYLPLFGHCYVFTDYRTWSALWEGMSRGGLSPKNMLVWDKGAGIGASYAMYFELVGFFAKLGEQRANRGRRETGQRVVLRPNVLRYNRVPRGERQHNAAKPVALLQELVANSSDAGQYVLDGFAGSGSTLLACERAGRRCLAVELEPEWCDTIIARWQAATGGKAVRHG